METRCNAFAQLAKKILYDGAYKATMYLDEKTTLKATRKRFKGKILKGHAVEIIFTLGKPNYEEREKIKQAKKLKLEVVEMTVKYPPEVKS